MKRTLLDLYSSVKELLATRSCEVRLYAGTPIPEIHVQPVIVPTGKQNFPATHTKSLSLKVAGYSEAEAEELFATVVDMLAKGLYGATTLVKIADSYQSDET